MYRRDISHRAALPLPLVPIRRRAAISADDVAFDAGHKKRTRQRVDQPKARAEVRTVMHGQSTWVAAEFLPAIMMPIPA